jgi:hypothetical protein
MTGRTNLMRVGLIPPLTQVKELFAAELFTADQ